MNARYEQQLHDDCIITIKKHGYKLQLINDTTVIVLTKHFQINGKANMVQTTVG